MARIARRYITRSISTSIGPSDMIPRSAAARESRVAVLKQIEVIVPIAFLALAVRD